MLLLQSPTQRMLSNAECSGGCTHQYCVRSRYAIAAGGSTQANQQVDVSVRQVMIEARFVEASDKFYSNLGGR